MRRVSFLCLLTAVCASPLFAQEKLENGIWNTAYTTPDGRQLRSVVTIETPAQGAGYGSYKTADERGVVVLEATLMNVLVELRERTSAAPTNIPLPPPGNDLGVTPQKTPFITGCWEAQGIQGWFRWEVYDDQGVPKFVGEWGYLENGMQGPAQGKWNGAFRQALDRPSGSGNPAGRPIPYVQIR